MLIIILLVVVWSLWTGIIYIKDRDRNYTEDIPKNVKKGNSFEEKIVKIIKEKIPESKIIRNIIIPNGKKGGTTEIDIVLISEYGNICIECKNYNAKVIGNTDDNEWVIVYGKGKKIKKYSALKQNTRHIMCLRALVKEYYQNVVIFNDNAKLCSDLEQSDCIIKYSDLEQLLDNFISLDKIQDSNRVENIYQLLKSYETSTDKRKHIEYVKNIEKKAITQ